MWKEYLVKILHNLVKQYLYQDDRYLLYFLKQFHLNLLALSHHQVENLHQYYLLPAKSTSSSLPNPMIVPVVVSSGSSPIPIAPSPRPLQPYTASLASSVMNKVTTVSVATGQSATLKRYVITRYRVHMFFSWE